MLKSMTIRSSLAALACLVSFSVHAMADTAKRVDIPRGQLTSALQTLAKQTGSEFVYSSQQLEGIQTQGVHGTYTTERAVTKLLLGTKLHVTMHASGAFLISDSAASEQKGPAAGERSNDKEAAQSRDLWGRFRMAQVDQEVPASASTVTTGTLVRSTEPGVKLEEVVVTAEKREERLQDVPIPMSTVTGETLAQTNQLRLADYYTQIPGLIVNPSLGSQTIYIRGLSQLGGNPTVGVLIDDVPFGGSTSIGGSFVPDLDPGDIARVEVLRGPQGTLYGASTEGGLIKYVTIDPSISAVAGRIEAGTSDVQNGAKLGYNMRTMINVPLGDELAIRLSAFTRLDPGWVDDPVRQVQGINEERVHGGRLAALWRPSDSVSVRFSALLQTDTASGLSDVTYPVNSYVAPAGYAGPPLAGLQQYYIPNAGKFEHDIQAYSATTTAKIGGSELTSITAYNIISNKNSFDFSSAWGTSVTYPLAGVTGTLVSDVATVNKFVQELRLDIPFTEQFDWLMGAYYTDESANPNPQAVLAEDPATGVIVPTKDPATGALVPDLITFYNTLKYEEYSAFTNLTYHFSDRVQIQMGGRGSHMRQSLAEIDTGSLTFALDNGPAPFVFPVEHTSDNALTYLVTPEFKISPHTMLYARIASGFRPSGLNGSALVNPGAPVAFRPDKTQNYEIGAKGDALGHVLSYDGSVYDIEWTDIQLGFITPNSFSYTGNGGHARSKGVELSATVRPIDGLTVSSWGNWNRAELTDNPANSTVYGSSGDRLAYVPVFSGNASVQDEFLLAPDLKGSIGASASYQGNRMGGFQSRPPAGAPPPVRQYYPAFAQINMHAGVTYHNWKSTFFVNNVTDRRGLINGGHGNLNDYAFIYIQPRTIGLSVSREF